MKISIIRKATELELNTPIETIPYSKIERCRKQIEKKNLITFSKSVCWSSMHLPYNIITCMYHEEDLCDIHKGWRDILKKEYILI